VLALHKCCLQAADFRKSAASKQQIFQKVLFAFNKFVDFETILF